MDEDKQGKKIDIDINKDILKWVIAGLAVFAMVVFVFGAGIFVGGMKAKFSYRWAESYHKNFAGPKEGFLDDWRRPSFPGDFLEGHGTFGEIIKVSDTDLVVKGQGDVEKIIITTKDTIIQKMRDTIKKEELKVGEQVVVIGSPNEAGQVEAKLIRVFDEEELKGQPKPSRFPFFR